MQAWAMHMVPEYRLEGEVVQFGCPANIVGSMSAWLEIGAACPTKAEHKDSGLMKLFEDGEGGDIIEAGIARVRALLDGPSFLELEEQYS